jgi:hypothetical protein
MDDSSGSSEDRNADRNMSNKDCAHGSLIGITTLLGTGLEAICVTFWQRTCLHFVPDLRLCGRLNIQVMG